MKATKKIAKVRVVKTRAIPTTADAMLKLLDSFFSRTRTQAEKAEGARLWDVLAALRGPDGEQYGLKARTTSVIRTIAFPKTASTHNHDLPASFGSKSTPIDTTGATSSHFEGHIKAAKSALRFMGRIQDQGQADRLPSRSNVTLVPPPARGTFTFNKSELE